MLLVTARLPPTWYTASEALDQMTEWMSSTPAMRVARVERVAAAPAPTPAAAAIVIEVGWARVRVEAGADAATLATVLSALAVAR